MQDLVDAICKRPPAEEGGADYAHDHVPELLRLIGRRNPLAPGSSFARAETPRREDSKPWLRRGTAYPYGDPLAQEASRSPREEQASATQARESTPETPAAARPHARPAYRTAGKIAADDDPDSDVAGRPDEGPFSLQPREPRWVAIAGVAGAVLIATLAAVGYYALSVSNTTVQAPVIAGNTVEANTTAAGQTVDGGELNQQAATSSWMNQPKNVRTFTIRPDAAAADTSAAELSNSTTARARPNADERREDGATRTSAAAFSDPPSEPGTSPASRPVTPVDEQKKVRASAAPPQVATRDGIACQAAAGSGAYWAWRMIDGRKCWYEGKPGMSKDNLHWVR